MKRITERLVQRLEPPKEGSHIEWDGQVPGFGVRITAAGVIAFVLQYSIHGRERRYTIGRWPEWSAEAARNEALDLRRQIQDGKDPLEERTLSRNERTLRNLADEYLHYAATYKRATSQRNECQMLNGIVLPRLGALQLKAVGRRDIELLHASLKATPYRANRILALLSKMFNLAIEWGWRTDNPVRGVPRFHEDKREHWLTLKELHKLHEALDAYPDQRSANAIRLLVLTGAREGEVLKADWDQFDLQRGIWTKPSHHTKQKKIEHTPLSADVISLLRAMKPKEGPLFPGTNGSARVTLRRPWVQVCKAAGLTEAVTLKGRRRTITRHKPTLRIHDLRHTYASHLVSSGVSLPTVGRLLGHTQPQTTARYAHLADESLRAATNSFAGMLHTSGEAKE